MAIESPRMGSGNTQYPNKRKLAPGNPPKLIQKAKDGGRIVQETPQQKYARYIATYGKAGADQKIQQEIEEAARVNPFAPSPSLPQRGYEPSEGVKNTKAGLAAFSLATAGLPPVSYLGNVAGSVYDFGTAARYAADGNWNKASEDALQGIVGLIPGFAGSLGTKGEQILTKGQTAANALLQTTQKASDVAQINESFKWGGKIKKMANGGKPQDPPRRRRASTNMPIAPEETGSSAAAPVANMPFAPYNQGLRPITVPERTKDSDAAGIIPTAPINPIDEDVNAWTQSYVESPKYRERLANFWKYPDLVQGERIKKVSNIGFTERPGVGSAYSDTSGYPNQLNIDTGQIESINANRAEVAAHELGHATNSNKTRRVLQVNAPEEKFILSRNRNLKPGDFERFQQRATEAGSNISNYLTSKDVQTEWTHDNAPSENLSDVQSLRYQLNKAGIYDARTQDITPEQLKQGLKNKDVQKSFSTQRLLKNFGEQGLIDILNRVAVNNNNQTEVPIAENGGTIASTHNNPGNMMYAGWQKKYGATKGKPRFIDGKPAGNYAKFPDVQSGQTAMFNLFTGNNYKNRTVKDAVLRWTGEGVYKTLPKEILDKKIGKLNPDELAGFLDAVTRGEDSKSYNWNIPETYQPNIVPYASNEPIQNPQILPTMKKGGLSRDSDYGSKSKPYPSVDKSDFAGGGRSYPIPTKADAVDALRLAGLHGRSDVRAKVFKKYPELKKKYGGTIWNYDKDLTQNMWYPAVPKGKYGLKMMDLGGLPDQSDPFFAQKLEEFIRNNPDAVDPFAPTTSSTPPGASGEQIYAPTPGELLDQNTNSQEEDQKRRGPKLNLPSINVGDAVAGVAQGLNSLATQFITNPRTRANEMRLLRRQLAPVTGKPSTGGFDMPILAKSGIQITSAYTDGIGRVPSKKKNPWGNVADQYKVDDPQYANVQTEGGEFMELPDGKTSNINGDLHSDYSGGELMNLPEGTKVYSDSIKVDKDFAKDLTGSAGKKKKTVAQIAKKYNTDHEEGILKDPTADNASKRTANIMKTFKQGQLQQLFDYQESVKDPMYMINKEQSAEDFLGSEDTITARNGVKVMQDGGKPPRRKVSPRNVSPFAPTDSSRYLIKNGQLARTSSAVTPIVQQVPINQALPNNNPWWNDLASGRQTLLPMRTGLDSNVINPLVESTPRYTTPDSTPEELVPPTSTPYVKLNLRVPDLENPDTVSPPELQPAVPPTTVTPGTTIDSSKPNKPIPDNNKENPPRPNPKIPWSNTLNNFGEIVPELTALIQNQTDFPIFTAKYQPRYLNPVELNIQAQLNRNYAQTRPLLQSTGNPAVDNARAAQATANLYDANNEAFMQKFNFDTQNRYQTDATNLQIENEANRYNLQRADDFWNKVTARQAVKEATNNNIANSAYAKFKNKQLEQRSLQLTNQLTDNFKYDPQRGVYFTPTGDEFIFHQPSGTLVNVGGAMPGDGVETTRTTRITPKGTTRTIRQKEKKNS